VDGRCVKRAGGRTRPTACAPSTDLAEARGDETWQSTDPSSTPQPVNARTVTRTRQTRKPRANRLPHAIATRRARRYRGRQVYLALAAEVEDTHELELRPMFQPCFSRVNTSPLRWQFVVVVVVVVVVLLLVVVAGLRRAEQVLAQECTCARALTERRQREQDAGRRGGS